MQPALIVRNHGGRAYDPDTGLGLFHQDLPAGILLTQGDLAIGAHNLDGRRWGRSSYDGPS